MTGQEADRSVRRLYWLTGLFGALGGMAFLLIDGPRYGLAFVLGAASSFGNLWLFHWLAEGLAPGDSPRKPWQAGAFATRYLLLFTFGYVIVKALGINPLAVVLGLLASTAAVLISSVSDLIQSFLTRSRTN